MDYRREIDGLRALAVLPVIFFHAGFETFSGGFVGVDMFFVISGYLITTIILAELEQGKFSIVNFYERRARRILPALFFVMLVCIPFAWFWLLPSDMKDFSQSLVAVSFFASNILFWRESGYFDSAAELKPLLHTWSLAVEEQYYVLFPLFLMLFWPLGKRWILVTLGLVFAASLAVAQWGAYSKPDAAFYLLPTRAWELLIGAFAAFYLSKSNHKEFGKAASEFYGWLGVVLIIYAVFSYSKATPFPGFYALVPTLGTVLVILFATQQTTVGKFVGNKAFVGVGLISYSAYLWHQPLFSFARHRSLMEPSHFVFLILSILALALAYFSWRFVEHPFRIKSFFQRKQLFYFVLIFSLFFVFFGITLSTTSLQYYRFDPAQIAIFKERDSNKIYMKEKAFDRFNCFFDQSQNASVLFENNCVTQSESKRIIVFGDSKAAHYLFGLKSLSENKDFKVMQFTGASCRAFDFQGNSSRCKEFYRVFLKKVVLTLTPNDVVIISSNWSNTYRSIGNELFEQGVKDVLLRLTNQGSRVLLVGNTPDFIKDPYELLATGHSTQDYFLPVSDFIQSEYILERLANEVGVYYFSPTAHLCNVNRLNCIFKDSEGYLFFDSGHLSNHGSNKMIKSIQKEFETLFN